jgi:hypothetical protein
VRIQERCRKKENLLERTYDELTLVDVFKKRYSEANNTVGSAARLRLVVCKDHQRRIDKNNLVPEVIEKQAGHGTTFKGCLPAAEIR